LSEQEAKDFCNRVSDEIGLPTVDALRDGVAAIVDNI
jgi:uncharacterized NAD-dependent epimerase/dehydratase family protein